LIRINLAHRRRNILQEEAIYERRGAKVFSIVIMLLLLVGFYGLFAGLVFFSKGVIEPDSTS